MWAVHLRIYQDGSGSSSEEDDEDDATDDADDNDDDDGTNDDNDDSTVKTSNDAPTPPRNWVRGADMHTVTLSTGMRRCWELLGHGGSKG